jgi:hypothetical protein
MSAESMTLGADRERVACYETLDGAARAASHLVELHHHADAISIRPSDYEVVTCDRARERVVRGLTVGGVVGAVLTTVVVLIDLVGASQLVRSFIPAVAIGAAVGACASALLAAVRHRRASALLVSDCEKSWQATRFDVVVSAEGKPAMARHDLARWWDPDARPAAPRRRAGAVEHARAMQSNGHLSWR